MILLFVFLHYNTKVSIKQRKEQNEKEKIKKRVDKAKNRVYNQSIVKETNYTMFEMYPDVLNVAQAAKAMNMGRNKIYSYLKSGKIKSIRDGNTESAKYFIPKIYLIDFVNDYRC